MSSPTPNSSFRVLIAGGGVAALEGALALRSLAGERLRITLLASEPEFIHRPMAVREPFSGPAAQHVPLRRVIEDFDLDHQAATLTGVDARARTVTTENGQTLSYDALLLATGARQRPRFRHALNLDDRLLDDQMHGLIQDVEGGITRRLVFVVPSEPCWPMPIYELALMTARRAYDMGLDSQVTVITPERAPLSVFGQAASQAVAEELSEYRVTAILASECAVTDEGQLRVHPTDGPLPADRQLPADRIIALPELYGPIVRGISAVNERGFIRVDSHCAVQRAEGVFAAGDITDFPVKHGGIAAQQADTAAEAIAALAGIEIEPRPFRPELKGILLGGRRPLYLRARLQDGRAVDSQASDEPLWPGSDKVAAQHLAPYLEGLGAASSGVN